MWQRAGPEVKAGTTHVPGASAGMAVTLDSAGTLARAPPCGFPGMMTLRSSDFSTSMGEVSKNILPFLLNYHNSWKPSLPKGNASSENIAISLRWIYPRQSCLSQKVTCLTLNLADAQNPILVFAVCANKSHLCSLHMNIQNQRNKFFFIENLFGNSSS